MGEKELKDVFLAEADKAKEMRGWDNQFYTRGMIVALLNMAKEDVYPDGRFSDEACAMWSMFRRMKGE